MAADPLAKIWLQMLQPKPDADSGNGADSSSSGWPALAALGSLTEKLNVYFKLPGFVEQNPGARQIDDAVTKAFAAAGNPQHQTLARALVDELLNGKYPRCTSLSGLVMQFCERSAVYSVMATAGAEVWRGASDD